MDTGDGRGRDRTAILVLGMHRSGMSAATRVMNILGAALPWRSMPRTKADPAGHVAPSGIVAIHERLLESAGTSWADWGAFPESWNRSNDRDAYLAELGPALAAGYADDDLFLVDDPRIARFVPLWLDLLGRHAVRPVAVLPYRNPIEVALSLNARDGFPRGHGFLLWLRYVLDAEVHSRAVPRAFVPYDRLLSDRQMTTYRLIEALPVAWPRKTAAAFDEIARVLDAGLRHSTATRDDLALHADVPDEVRRVYEAYERLADDPQDRAAMALLDAVRAEFDTASALMSATFRSLRERFEQERRDTRQMQADLATLGRDCATLRERIEMLDRRGEETARALDPVHEQLRTLHDATAQAAERDRACLERTEKQADAIKAMHAGVMRVRGEQDFARYRREQGARHRWRFRQKRSAREHRIELVLRSGLFDPAWYAARYMAHEAPDKAPIEHFVDVGSARHDSPGPLFDAQWYIRAHPDLAGQDVEPLFHYLSSGMREGRLPLPG